MSEHPKDLASFRTALLEGDRRLMRRRRKRAASGAAGTIAAALLVVLVVLPLGGGTLDAPALASEARAALTQPGLVLHSETEVVLPDGSVDQRISRWSRGDRSRTVSDDGQHTVEQVSDGRAVRVRLQPGGPVDTLPASAAAPDPLLAYRELLDRASARGEVEEVGEAYRLTVPGGEGRVAQVAYLRRSDRLPLRVVLEGGTTVRYRIFEWLPDAQLDFR